jgi:hypothetical protein
MSEGSSHENEEMGGVGGVVRLRRQKKMRKSAHHLHPLRDDEGAVGLFPKSANETRRRGDSKRDGGEDKGK